jgi:ribosomal protein L11 methyltransferase
MNWAEQWELFAPNFKNGKAHIETPGGTIELLPGPGFGDFSHPTTRLALQLMAPYVKDKNVIDIGCGSGILSIAAAAMGAESVYGYDIDPASVEHARQNKNSEKITFANTPPTHIPHDAVIVMNMISSEQAHAWNISFHPGVLITSGVLEEDRAAYLEWTASLGWTLKQAACEDGWCGFVF